MKNDNPTRPVARLRQALIVTLAIGALFSLHALAQVPGRFYWKTLSDANAVPLIFNSISGNSNPFDPSHNVTPGAKFDATLVMAGYARTFSLFDHAAMAAVIVPMGRISGEVTAAGRTISQSTQGFGDPMLEFNLNLLGPRAQKSLPDALRYEPGFSVDLLADLALPIGEYDHSQPLNLGQHRWYGRLGAPIIWQIGEWVPGRRTTLEFLPAVWIFGANDDYVGQMLETDPMFQLDAHLTRDFTEHFWGAFDSSWYTGGRASIDGVKAEKGLNNVGLGFTLGYTINDNLALTCGYMSTVADHEPGEMQMDGLKFTLVFGWHKIIEGAKRLEGEKK
jgi:hypothetical protein